MRFDDTLETVLAADLTTPIGVQSAWRQLVDLIGRRRVPADARAMARLRTIREQVPTGVRAASARALEYANPPAALVRLFAIDDLRVAMPVMRTARMTSSEWIELLPDLAPSTRAILRNRRDLSPAVKRALESFGPIDFVLPDQSLPEPVALLESEAEPIEAAPEPLMQWPAPEPIEPEPQVEPAIEPEPVALVEPEPEVEIEVEPESEIAEPEPEPIATAEPEPEPVPVEAAVEPAAATEEHPAIDAGPMLIGSAWFGFRAPVLYAEPAEDTLADDAPTPAAEEPLAEDVVEAPAAPVSAPAAGSAPEAEPETAPEPEPDLSFIALAEGSLLAPVQSGTAAPDSPIAAAPAAAQEGAMEHGTATLAEAPDTAQLPAHEALADDAGTFEIADVVARIDAFWRNREEAPQRDPAPASAEAFRFETDAAGIIRWVDGVSRAPVIGLSLDLQGSGAGTGFDGPRVDGVAAGAFRRRASFANARMLVEGESDAAGDWRISAVPVFDPANGRFTGYRGTGRRPRADERAEPQPVVPASTPADSLRQLVHELRTPTNAIAGFAEMIETQMLGPVADPYRDRAGDIRVQARELLGAIDDLDLAARIDSAALALVPGRVPLRPLLAGIADDLAALVALRGSSIALPIDDLAVNGDRRAVERLLARLLATLVSASGEGERICVRLSRDADDFVTVTIDRPKALADYPGESVLGIDDEHEDATLLGTGFALRLARNLARELGGSMVIEPESLTLRLPAAVTIGVDQAHLS